MRVRRTETGSQAVFSCEGGYQIQGEVTISCTDNGFWSDIEPTCEGQWKVPGWLVTQILIMVKGEI